MATPDIVHLLLNILGASDVAPLVTHPTTRNNIPVTEVAIYGEKLPPRPLMDPSGIVNKPATSLVVKSYPGTRGEEGDLYHMRFLLRAYASSLTEARELAEICEDILHDETFDVELEESTIRVETEKGTGPTADLETGTDFPFCDNIYTASVL